MNIKEHIEAGHYERDEKGRALVPTDKPRVRAVIVETECPVGEYLLGWSITNAEEDGTGRDYCWRLAWWRPNGEAARPEEDANLLPPPPRKVEVKAWGVFHGSTMQGSFGSEQHARNMAKDWAASWKLKPTVIELTGSYEEEW